MKRLFQLAALLLVVALPAFAAPPVRLTLLSNATATEAGYVEWPGGIGVFEVVSSSFGGATVKLQFMGPDVSTWVDVGTSTSCTANCGGTFYLPKNWIRAAVTGGPPTGVYALAGLVEN